MRRSGRWYMWHYRRHLSAWSAGSAGAGWNPWRRGREIGVGHIKPGRWREVTHWTHPLPTGTDMEIACDSPWHPANRPRREEPRPALDGEQLAETLARGAERRKRARERQGKATR